MWVQSLGWKDPLEEGMATHSSILAWRIPGQRSVVGYSLWCKELDTTEWLSTHTVHNPGVYFLLKYNCFTMLLVSAVQWSESAVCVYIYIYIYPFTLGPLTLPAFHLESWSSELHFLCFSAVPLVICYHMIIYMLIPISQFFPPFFSPLCIHMCLLSTSASLFLPWK